MNRLWLEWKIPDEVKEILDVCSHVVLPGDLFGKSFDEIRLEIFEWL
ncbi:MAG: hypothetical protein MRK01_16380 [Candidatus Scalindua sp.]|nr:hypothetical protein [Candidatus Scalindua sp.]